MKLRKVLNPAQEIEVSKEHAEKILSFQDRNKIKSGWEPVPVKPKKVKNENETESSRDKIQD